MTNKKSPDSHQDFSNISIITADQVKAESQKLIEDYCNFFQKNPDEAMAALVEDVCVHSTVLAQLQQAILVKNGQLQKVIDNQQKVIQKLEDAAKVRTSQISKRLEKLEGYQERGM